MSKPNQQKKPAKKPLHKRGDYVIVVDEMEYDMPMPYVYSVSGFPYRVLSYSFPFVFLEGADGCAWPFDTRRGILSSVKRQYFDVVKKKIDERRKVELLQSEISIDCPRCGTENEIVHPNITEEVGIKMSCRKCNHQWTANFVMTEEETEDDEE